MRTLFYAVGGSRTAAGPFPPPSICYGWANMGCCFLNYITWSLKLWFDIFGGNVVICPRQEAPPCSGSSNIGPGLRSREKGPFPQQQSLLLDTGLFETARTKKTASPSTLLRPWNQVSRCWGCHGEKLLGNLFQFPVPGSIHQGRTRTSRTNCPIWRWLVERVLSSLISSFSMFDNFFSFQCRVLVVCLKYFELMVTSCGCLCNCKLGLGDSQFDQWH